MIRIAESLAKMRLAQFVEAKDVDEAVRLITHALQQSATDPRTGKINMDILTTGQTMTNQERLKLICEQVKLLQQTYQDKINKDGLKYQNLYNFLCTKASNGAFLTEGQENNG